MIRELLQTVGNPDVFFASEENRLTHWHITTNEQFKALNESVSNTKKFPGVLMSEMSFGQTRDFINAVADELGEPL